MKQASVAATLAACLLFGFGCASLIIRPTDSAGVKVAKFTSRFLLAIPTFGFSEIDMAEAMRIDAEERANAAEERANAAKKKRREQRLKEFYAYLDAGVGLMTVDDAISMWGPPTSHFDGDAILVAKWSEESTTGFMSQGSELQLSFDKSTGKLSDWKYKEW